MSYILDALQRADAERTRGHVPDLHARQVAALAVPAQPNARHRLWLAGSTVLLLATVAAGLWLWQTPAQNAPLAAVAPAVMQPAVRAPLLQADPLPTTPSPTVAPTAPLLASASTAQPVPPPLVPALPTIAPLPLKFKPDLVAKAAAPVASAPPTAMPMTKAIAKVSATQTQPVGVPLLSELAEDIRRQIPALTITGAVYSDNPAQRLLLVNNQVLAQGSLVAPELSLEEIKAKSSVFNFRGTRFRLAH
jgi:general secretion pathway protein B